jgi:glucose dehydrogenase
MKNILVTAIVITLIHWIVADMGVWLSGSMYAETVTGFWACLSAAIPFERNFLAATLLYSAIMFGTFEWMKLKYPALRIA